MTNFELDKCIIEYMHGNVDSFDKIYSETKGIVFLSIRSIISSNDLVKDLMQDTYIKMINSLDSYRIGTNFKAWISKIARNLAINESKKYSKYVFLDNSPFEYSKENASENETVYYTLNLLKEEKMRNVFMLKIVFDMNFRDISKIMDIPKSTVYDLYKKALKIVKDNIKEI